MKNWDVKSKEYKADPDWKKESRWVLLIVKKEFFLKNGICKNKKKWGKRNHQKILNTRFVPHHWGYKKVKEEKEVKTKTNWSGKTQDGCVMKKG